MQILIDDLQGIVDGLPEWPRVKAFWSQSFVSGVCPNSNAMDMHILGISNKNETAAHGSLIMDLAIMSLSVSFRTAPPLSLLTQNMWYL